MRNQFHSSPSSFSIKILSVLFLTATVACSHKPTQEAVSVTEGLRLAKIISNYTEQRKHLDAFYDAINFKLEDDLGKFGDFLTPASIQKEKDLNRDSLKALQSLNASALTGEELTTYKLFAQKMDLRVRLAEFPDEELSFTQWGNRLSAYIDSANAATSSFPFDSLKHYHDYLSRSQGFPTYVNRQITVMKKGLQEGVVLYCDVAKRGRSSYQAALTATIEENPFWKPMKKIPSSISASDASTLKKQFKKMITSTILPGYRKFDHFYTNEYLPHCLKGFGLKYMPNGDAWYQLLIEEQTTLKANPEDLHKLGLNEVDQLTHQMKDVMDQLGYHGDFAKNLHKISQSKDAYYENSEDLFAAFVEVKNKVNLVVPKFFILTAPQ